MSNVSGTHADPRRREAGRGPLLVLIGTPGTGKRPRRELPRECTGFVHLDFENAATRERLPRRRAGRAARSDRELRADGRGRRDHLGRRLTRPAARDPAAARAGRSRSLVRQRPWGRLPARTTRDAGRVPRFRVRRHVRGRRQLPAGRGGRRRAARARPGGARRRGRHAACPCSPADLRFRLGAAALGARRRGRGHRGRPHRHRRGDLGRSSRRGRRSRSAGRRAATRRRSRARACS